MSEGEVRMANTWKVAYAHDQGMFTGETKNVELLEEALNDSPGYIVQGITSMGTRRNILVAVLLNIDSDEFRAMRATED
jgi:hypothetical protein